MNELYAEDEPARAEIDQLAGFTLLEFGSPFCGHCLRAQPVLADALQAYQGLRHIKIFDGRGRRLGRSFRVKLWPTLIVLRDGVEMARVVRPQNVAEIAAGLGALDEEQRSPSSLE